jgi:hypothetical protein
MRYLVTICLIGQALMASAQSYPAEYIQHRNTVNYPDHYITFFVRPLKEETIPDPQKRYYWYSANDVRSTQGGFSGKLLNGPYSDFYKNKQLKEQGNFTAGLKTGNWRSWSDNGILKEDSRWRKGLQSGPFLKYDNSGRLSSKAKYRNGQLHGKNILYEGADSTKVVYYKNGKVYTPKPLLPAFIRKLFKKKDQGAEKP